MSTHITPTLSVGDPGDDSVYADTVSAALEIILGGFRAWVDDFDTAFGVLTSLSGEDWATRRFTNLGVLERLTP